MTGHLRLDIITIFPEYLAPLRQSLLGKAVDSGLVRLGVHDLRQWATDVHRSVDDPPYGVGTGDGDAPGALVRRVDRHCAGRCDADPSDTIR
ncbi:MAG: hypothetical protein WKF47_16220 [Geodermatophilaceae bacterium]